MTVENSFHYPDDRRMCSAGQRRAVAEGWNLLVEGGEIGEDKTINRAARAQRDLVRGASTNKHNLISLVVLERFLDGTLTDYVDPEGNYVLETAKGERYPRNLFTDIETQRPIF